MRGDRRPSPPPLEGNDQLVTAAITAAWAIALIVLLALRSGLGTADQWWLWTCVAGVVLGVFGLWYVPRMKRARARKAARHRAALAERQSERDSKSVSSTDTPGRSTRS